MGAPARFITISAPLISEATSSEVVFLSIRGTLITVLDFSFRNPVRCLPINPFEPVIAIIISIKFRNNFIICNLSFFVKTFNYSESPPSLFSGRAGEGK
jgi:hypothetical protein